MSIREYQSISIRNWDDYDFLKASGLSVIRKGETQALIHIQHFNFGTQLLQWRAEADQMWEIRRRKKRR